MYAPSSLSQRIRSVSRNTANTLSATQKPSRTSAPHRSTRTLTWVRLSPMRGVPSRVCPRSGGLPELRDGAVQGALQFPPGLFDPNLQLAEGGASGFSLGPDLLRQTLGF